MYYRNINEFLKSTFIPYFHFYFLFRSYYIYIYRDNFHTIFTRKNQPNVIDRGDVENGRVSWRYCGQLTVQYILHRDKRWDTQYDVTLSFRYKGLLLPYNIHPYLPQYVISSLLLHNYIGWDCGMHYHIETKTKLLPFRRRHIQMHFLKWKYMKFV